MIYGDYHTHTTYSHGKGSVLDNAAKAVEVGLQELAITDHGFKHKAFNVRKRDWPYLIEDVKKAGESFPQLRVLVGIESNLLDNFGSIDVDSQQLNDLDLLICGYHKFTGTTSAAQYFKFTLPVYMSGLLHKSSAKRIVANTDAYINAIQRYPIDIISHPGFGFKVDFRQLAKAAAYYGTLLEINGKKVSFSAKNAHDMLEEGASFIVDSDAHTSDRVGEISTPLKFIKEANIPLSSIANWNKQPKLRGGGNERIGTD